MMMYHADWKDNSTPISIRVPVGKTVRGAYPQNYVICRDRKPIPTYCVEPKNKR